MVGSTLLSQTSVATRGVSPYKFLLSHGFVMDGEGKKMSKSLGNVIVPDQVVKQKGADIARLWVSSTDYLADVRISDEILKQTSDVYASNQKYIKIYVR
ncbi:class I tRNA ligase family protein [Staphylococcus aureus]